MKFVHEKFLFFFLTLLLNTPLWRKEKSAFNKFWKDEDLEFLKKR